MDGYPSNRDYRRKLHAIIGNRLAGIVHTLISATDPRLKYPLQIRSYDGRGSSLISVDPARYSKTIFSVSDEPQEKEGVELRKGHFGYSLSEEFRRIGPVNFVRMDSEGNVLEMGFGSDLLAQHFRYHLFGRTLSERDLDRIVEIQEAVFVYLGSIPKCQEEFADFVASRKWPEGIAEKARLAYFNDIWADLRTFARSKGFSEDEMQLAGWFDLNFNKQGEGSYSVRDRHVIRIPYFRNGRIEVWRTRNLRASRAETHKYTSWPLNRSINNQPKLEHKLYYAWKLHQVRGKPLIITEGEFKCLIATSFTGIWTVGIPGITEVDDFTIQSLVQARASEYIVVLDRDPVGKGLMRVDGITDSQRAAYLIALRLRKAGARNVRVGQIPNIRQGEKVGLDDLILDCGKSALLDVIEKAARDPFHYAARIDLNISFCEIWHARQLLGKAIEHYDNSVRRGGSVVSSEIETEARQIRDQVEELYKDFLSQRYFGARRLNQPVSELYVHFRSEDIADVENKLVMAEDGGEIPLRRFTDDIVVFEFMPKDMPDELVWIRNPNLRIPYASREIQEFVRDGSTTNRRLSETVSQGMEILARDNPSIPVGNLSLTNFSTAVIAGHLVRWFPGDEYYFKWNVELWVRHEEYWEELVRIPLVIFRKGTDIAIAFSQCVMWDNRDDLPFTKDLSTQASNLVKWFFRHTNAENANDKFGMIVETLWPYWFERNREATERAMAQFGVTAETIEQHKLLVIRPEDTEELSNHLLFRRLFNQSSYVGLFRRTAKGKIALRFQDTVALIPVRDEGRAICALRVIPFNIKDHVPPSLPPSPRLVRHLYGIGRYLVNRFDPERHLYMQEHLSQAKGKVLIMTYHELDALALSPSGKSIVALNSSFNLNPEVTARIAKSQPERICLVISGQEPQSCYDLFDYDGVLGYLKEVYDLQQDISASFEDGQHNIQIHIAVMATPLTKTVTEENARSCADQLIQEAVDLNRYLDHQGFNPSTHEMVRRFLKISSRFMDYLEISSLPDLLDTRPIDWYVRESRRLYAALQTYVLNKHRKKIDSVESYFQKKLGLASEQSLEELLRQRKEEGKVFIFRPVYGHSKTYEQQPEMLLSSSFCELFAAVVDVSSEQAESKIRNALQKGKTQKKIEKAGGEKPIDTDNPKVLVLQLIQASTHAPPKPVAEFVPTDDGFTCMVSVGFNGQIFSATGKGKKKKEAEVEAYKTIWGKVSGMEQAEPKDVPVSDDAAKVRVVLKMDPGDRNYVGCVFKIAQTAKIPDPEFTTKTMADEKTITFTTRATIRLPDDVLIESDEKIAGSKQKSRQEAASDLITKIWNHYSN